MANELENSKENGVETKETKSEPAKVDTASLEARIKQLESENGKLKQAQTNASADASEWKKKYQSKLSEEDKAREEQETANAAMQKELELLRAERDIANYTGTLTAPGIGMDAETAKDVATAMQEGNMAKVIDGIRKFMVSHDKAMAEKAMLNNPVLPGGDSTKTVTKEQFDNMGLEEMIAFHNDHPDLYREYMNKS
jgi:septal ring factor EnvC (AmiA/AmiB activator)